MNLIDQNNVERSMVRREEDRMIRDQIERHKMLFELGQIVASEMNLNSLFEVIMEQTNLLMNTERSSVFIFDEKDDQLWVRVSTDLKRNEIRMPVDHGLAGWVFRNRAPLIINDAYSDPRFFPEIDELTGFRTRNILCIPLINREKECIGTLQALNRKSGEFTEKDMKLLTSASHYITIALENARLYEDLKALDKARERVINHLSHEMKTPLAVIAGVFSSIHNKLKDAGIKGLKKTLDRGDRSLDRLKAIQEKTDDILNQGYVEEKRKLLDLIAGAVDLTWEISQSHEGYHADILESVSDRLESLLGGDEVYPEELFVGELSRRLCEHAMRCIGERNIHMVQHIDNNSRVFMDKKIFEKVFSGLLKNAIENTPDEGTIEISVEKKDGAIHIMLHDYGVGITAQNQKMIFGGFFHTQDTQFYSTKRPYEFNAGGTGSDLLRIKCFSERYGFSVDFESTRCKFIPEDTDACPGKILECKFVKTKQECLSSGGSSFSIKIPIKNDNGADSGG